MRSHPFLWAVKQLAGGAAGWSLASGEPWRQTLLFTLVWLVAVAATPAPRDPRPSYFRRVVPSRN